MNNTPIPIPFRQRWLDFRVIYIPILVFVALCFSIIWMWSRVVAPASVVGEVEAIRASVISSVPGTLISLNVIRMQRVTNGQCVAVLSTMEPLAASNELAMIEADLKVMKSRMAISDMGNATKLTDTRLALLNERLNVAMAQVNLTQAASEFARTEQLFKENLVPAGGPARNTLELAQRNRDLYKAEIEQRNRLVEQYEAELKNLTALGGANTNALAESIEKDIDAQKRRFESLNLQIPLRAPIDGYVSVIRCQSGERVSPENPILVIASENADRVIAWVRQPVNVMPKVGDVVQVRRPLISAKTIPATIIQVGGQFEPLAAGVMPLNFMSNRVETGLPFLAQLPKNSKLIPGEPVQLDIPKHPRDGSF